MGRLAGVTTRGGLLQVKEPTIYNTESRPKQNEQGFSRLDYTHKHESDGYINKDPRELTVVAWRLFLPEALPPGSAYVTHRKRVSLLLVPPSNGASKSR